jgi:bacterioferritin-associated ferredoxin
MYVCLCHGLNERAVHAAIAEGGAGSPAQVWRHLELKPRCGKCVPTMRDMIDGSESPHQCQGGGQCGRCDHHHDGDH